MKKIFAILALGLLLVSAAASADTRAGMSAWQRGDYARAHAEFGASANRNDAEAMYMLGQMHAQGHGTLQNYVEAHKWFNLAAAKGYREAASARGEIERKMTPEQISSAQRSAQNWKPDAARAEPEPGKPSRATVRSVQSELNRIGYRVGKPDGVAGKKTRQAIRDFQQRNDLKVDGKVSRSLLAELRAAPGKKQSAATAGNPEQKSSADLEKLIAEVEALLTDAEKRRLAEPSFIARMRSTLRRHSWPWKRDVFLDRFEDGDFHSEPAWSVASGQFQVSHDAGLRSVVTAAAPPAAQGEQDLGSVLLGAVLSEVSRRAGMQSSDSAQAAEIYLARKIHHAFAMRMSMASGASQGELEFGPYQGEARDGGYRLRIVAGRPLELVRSTRFGGSVVEVSKQVPDFADGKQHVVQWTRDADGHMEVAVDGKVVIEVADRGVQGDYAGFTVLNKGGDYSFRSIAVMDAGK